MSDFITVEYDENYIDLCQEFDCGNIYINNFLKTQSNHNPDIGKTFLWIGNNKTLIGYYNITTGYIDQIDEFGNRIKIGGSIHISYFAIHNKYHGKYILPYSKYSDYLLSDCINRIYNIQQNYVGFSFITLMSTEEGHALYLRNGFDDIEEDMNFSGDKKEKFCYPMYLALGLEEI